MRHDKRRADNKFAISDEVMALPFEAILEIRALAGTMRQKEIGERYGLSKDQVRNIINGKSRRSG